MSKDTLGDRMKSYYENRTKTYLPRRSNVIIRIDGCHFHTFTKGLIRPFDEVFTEAMTRTTKDLCTHIQGAKLGFVESDEISILLTDYDSLETDAWFDYSVQKLCSVSASMASMFFNKHFMDVIDENLSVLKSNPERLTKLLEKVKLGAYFDARCFTLPRQEVCNYFIWRQNDTIRNSVSSVAQAHFSQKQLNGKSQDAMKKMLLEELNIDWERDTQSQWKRGSAVVRTEEGWETVINLPLFTEARTFIENCLPAED